MSAIDSSKTLAAMLQLQAARSRGEKVSEFTSARTHAEFFLNQFIDALNSGVSYSETVSCLAVSAGCSRHTASDILGKTLRKAGYIKPEVAQHAELKPIEIIAPVIEKELVEPVIPIAEKAKPKPIKPIKKTKPVSIPPDVKISDSAKYIEKTGVVQNEKTPGKWDHLRGDIVLGPGRFMGEEHRWASPETLQKEKDDLAYLRKMSEEEDRRREERKKAKVLKALQQETQIQSDKEQQNA